MKKQPTSLITVEQALNQILSNITPVEAEQQPLAQVWGRVLATPITASTNVPPFANSAMDGYAVLAEDTQLATPDSPVRLTVVENIPAGIMPIRKVVSQTASRIMTGAPMPDGATAVIRFEETSEYINTQTVSSGQVLVYQPVQPDDNVRFAGEDIQTGQEVLQAGHRLRPQDVGVIAAIGQAEVSVFRRPKVAILATGDELVELHEPMTVGKIRNSNEYTQAAMVQKYGGQPIMLGIARDNVADLTAKINMGLAENVDLFLTSAGVSVGDFDVVKHVLAEEGEMAFWQVGIKPGKPLAFGYLEGGVPLLGLPGNPVAAMVAFEVFARPALLKLAGLSNWQPRTLQATLAEDVTNSGRRHYMRAVVTETKAGYQVSTRDSGVRVQGSGILTSMVWANGLVVVPESVTHLAAGELVTVWMLD
ncbi:molybdopterin molybdotransferase MoeA [Anaerolineales bacterium HSG25]|nr:molybdopterin molybdotransferase MoeA [Anaerolineales bacterium HSG25]